MKGFGPKATTAGLLACLALALAARCGRAPDASDVTQLSDALTVPFPLPVVVGLSPADIALGATNTVTINDLASVTANPGASNSIVSLGTTGTTSIGSNSRAGKIWSRPNIFLRGCSVTYYRTTGTASAQAGTVVTDPDENRTGVPIRQDPMWTVSLTAPNSGLAAINIDTGTRALMPGNYGATKVSSGATLQLNGAGNYGFFSLDIEPGAIVQISAPASTTISVNSSLILRAPLGGTGLIFAYLGTAAAFIQNRFTGDLFLAPRADLSIMAPSTGHFFANNITLFEADNILAPALSARSQTFVSPTATVNSLGNNQFDTFNGATEISTAVITPPSCNPPVAFMSTYGYKLLYRTVPSIGAMMPTAAKSPDLPAATPSPAACIGSFPGNPAPPWAVLPGGVPFYKDTGEPDDAFDTGAATDAVMVRLDGGRAVHVGFTERHCRDPIAGQTSGPNCPASQPATKDPCNAAATTGTCFYGSTPGTACNCPPKCGLTNAICASNADCCSGVCVGAFGIGICGPTTNAPAEFVCSGLVREEARVTAARMSTDCGATWTAGPIDQTTLGLPKDKDRDRVEAYFDPFDKKLYVSERTSPDVFADTVFVAPTTGIMNASDLAFVIFDHFVAGALVPRPMTTALDDSGLFSDGSHRRWVHFMTAHCQGSYGTLDELRNARPLLDVQTPLGMRTFDLSTAGDSTTLCGNLVLGPDHTDSKALFRFLHHGPSLIGISSSPPRALVAYLGIKSVTSGGVTTEHQIMNVCEVTIRTTGQYGGPIRSCTADANCGAGSVCNGAECSQPPTGAISCRQIDFSGMGQDVLFPQLIRADGQSGSDLTIDTPVILRYSLWSGLVTDASGTNSGTVTERALVINSGLWGPTLDISPTPWKVDTACTTKNDCFVGDYRYGAFEQKAANGRLTFFLPWTGQGTAPGVGTGVFPEAKTIDITP